MGFESDDTSIRLNVWPQDKGRHSLMTGGVNSAKHTTTYFRQTCITQFKSYSRTITLLFANNFSVHYFLINHSLWPHICIQKETKQYCIQYNIIQYNTIQYNQTICRLHHNKLAEDFGTGPHEEETAIQ